MNAEWLFQYLRRTFPELVGKGPEFRINCLNSTCQDTGQHLYINIEKGVFHCFKCAHKGSAVDLVSEKEKLSLIEARRFIKETSAVTTQHLGASELSDRVENMGKEKEALKSYTKFRMPEQIPPPVGFRMLTPRSPSKYVIYARKKRRLGWATIKEYKIGYCAYGPLANRLVVPIFFGGQMRGWAARAIITNDTAPKILFPRGMGKHLLLFNYDRLKSDGTIMLFEGIFSALRFPEIGVACLGASLSDPQLELLLRLQPKRIVLAFDGDRPGRKGMLDVGARLKSFTTVKYLVLPDGRQPDHYLKPELLDIIAGQVNFSERLILRSFLTPRGL